MPRSLNKKEGEDEDLFAECAEGIFYYKAEYICHNGSNLCSINDQVCGSNPETFQCFDSKVHM